jgi:hypothetical protein
MASATHRARSSTQSLSGYTASARHQGGGRTGARVVCEIARGALAAIRSCSSADIFNARAAEEVPARAEAGTSR